MVHITICLDTVSYTHLLCGTRGWPFDDAAAQGEKLMAREAGRLRMSLQAAGDTPRKIAFLHYPPVYPGASAKELVEVLQEFGVTECYYGHLHGKSIRCAVQGLSLIHISSACGMSSTKTSPGSRSSAAAALPSRKGTPRSSSTL